MTICKNWEDCVQSILLLINQFYILIRIPLHEHIILIPALKEALRNYIIPIPCLCLLKKSSGFPYDWRNYVIFVILVLVSENQVKHTKSFYGYKNLIPGTLVLNKQKKTRTTKHKVSGTAVNCWLSQCETIILGNDAGSRWGALLWDCRQHHFSNYIL